MTDGVISLPLSEAHASPLARRMAVAAGLEARQLKGTGRNGRIGKIDVDVALGRETPSPRPPAKRNENHASRRLALAIGVDARAVERLCTHLNERALGVPVVTRDDILVRAAGAALRQCGAETLPIDLGLLSPRGLTWRRLPQGGVLSLGLIAAARADDASDLVFEDEDRSALGIVIAGGPGLSKIEIDPFGRQEAILSWGSALGDKADAVSASFVAVGERFDAATATRFLTVLKSIAEEPILLLG